MDDFLEGFYLLIFLLVMWGLSLIAGFLFSSDSMMVLFFWISSILVLVIYSLIYKRKGRDLSSLKRQMTILIPIWLFLIYQSYITIKNVQMTSSQRWALIPFVLGLGFYITLLKQNLKKTK